MEKLSLVFLVAYGALILWGLWIALRPYRPSEQAAQFLRMAKRVGASVANIGESNLGLHLPAADRLCTVCKQKEACDAWLASHEAAAQPPDFCPNAAYLRLARR